MEGVVEPETRDSPDSTIVNTISNSDVSSVVPPGSSGEVNNNDLLGLSDESMAAEHTVVKENQVKPLLRRIRWQRRTWMKGTLKR